MLVLDGQQVSPFGRDRRVLLLHAYSGHAGTAAPSHGKRRVVSPGGVALLLAEQASSAVEIAAIPTREPARPEPVEPGETLRVRI